MGSSGRCMNSDNPKSRYDLGLGRSCGEAGARFESRVITRAHPWPLGSRARQRAACERFDLRSESSRSRDLMGGGGSGALGGEMGAV